MKIVIVLTYYNRPFQLQQTLKSFTKTAHNDFEVIIVDDCSPDKPHIGISDFPVEVIRTKNKKWLDGSPAYNLGFIRAFEKNPDVIIIQNAETYHEGDIINYATTVTDDTYISFACYNLSREWTFRKHDLSWIIYHYNNHAVDNEQNAWLNHKIIRYKPYNWCSAITSKNLRILNGFDERFSDGYCCEDDELLARIQKLGLKIEVPEKPFVVHQWHDRNYVPENWDQLYKINRELCESIYQSDQIRAIHKFTNDL
ncbi:MAG TPA: glycosyltransferase [Bacteroidales bacterium]|nr:glycosyltransferase [Bacteroidales bacterium]